MKFVKACHQISVPNMPCVYIMVGGTQTLRTINQRLNLHVATAN